jgi:hypothetical protein
VTDSNIPYRWTDAGEEWSRPWGNSAALWFGAIYPRIHGCLPARHVLEIAPGFGRWTQFLRTQCDRLSAVDSASECVDACRARFAGDQRVQIFQNDGKSLEMIEDDSIDFAFTFDSLVHSNVEIVDAYVRQLARKLTRRGRAFIHHSNLAMYPLSARPWPKPFRKAFENVGLITRTNRRASDMSAGRFRELSARAGLICLSQELVNWRSKGLIDCFSVVARADGGEQATPDAIANPHFMQEAELIRLRSRLYQRDESGSER